MALGILAPELKGYPQDSLLGSSVALSSSLHMVARRYWQLSLTSFHQILLKKKMPIYLLLWQKFRTSFDYNDLRSMLFPDLITEARGEENTAWPGLDLEWDQPHPNNTG